MTLYLTLMKIWPEIYEYGQYYNYINYCFHYKFNICCFKLKSCLSDIHIISSITKSLGPVFDVTIKQATGGRARIYVQTLDRHDGSYIVRFRPFATFRDLEITILFQGKHVSMSPYSLKGLNINFGVNSSFNPILV